MRGCGMREAEATGSPRGTAIRNAAVALWRSMNRNLDYDEKTLAHADEGARAFGRDLSILILEQNEGRVSQVPGADDPPPLPAAIDGLREALQGRTPAPTQSGERIKAAFLVKLGNFARGQGIAWPINRECN